MKKEYHYTISRTDRICLVFFVGVLLAWELAKGFIPHPERKYEYQSMKKERKEFPAKNKYPKKEYTFKSKWKTNFERKPGSNYKTDYPKLLPPPSPLPLKTASINELISMGFSAKVAFNIQKYTASGGILSSHDDLMKIYGMDSLQIQKATPYIIYDDTPTGLAKPIYRKEYTEKSKEIINLNTATLEDLETLNGIGKVLAERIIKFRELLGGFSNSDQLKDCYGISPEVLEIIKPQLITTGPLKIIHINNDDLVSINHPYLNKKMIKLITAYKDHHGPIMNASELQKVYPADTNWFSRILPYISFEVSGEE